MSGTPFGDEICLRCATLGGSSDDPPLPPDSCRWACDPSTNGGASYRQSGSVTSRSRDLTHVTEMPQTALSSRSTRGDDCGVPECHVWPSAALPLGWGRLDPLSLTLRGVTKSFGRRQVVDIDDLELHPGEILGLLGPNGAGKTTTIRLIIGMIKPDAGRICWMERDTDGTEGPAMGYLPEERGLYGSMNVGEQLMFFARASGLSRTEARAQVDRYLNLFDIDPAVTTRDLSKGNQQKVQLLISMLHKPDLLVLDEPFTALDPLNYELFRKTIVDLASAGTAIILSTHDMEEAQSLCDRVYFIKDGQIILRGSVDELRAVNQSVGVVLLETESALDAVALSRLPLAPVSAEGRKLRFQMAPGQSASQLFAAVSSVTRVTSFHHELPTLREIFLQAVRTP